MRIRTEDGRALYPVCSWEQNQHKLYNAHDILMNAIYEADDAGRDSDKLYGQLTELERIIGAFNNGVRFGNDGLVYATWEDGKRIKDYILAYDARH